jgi:succinate dehydrogenase / fumarate reductase, iron-sulfur subunit
MDTFDIDRDHCGAMVLDALNKINDQIGPILAFRRFCREGVCGSCAMNIDGVNTLACLTPMDSLKKGASRITPLPHMPVLKDLVPDLGSDYDERGSHLLRHPILVYRSRWHMHSMRPARVNH